MTGEFDKFHNKAIGFFDGNDPRNNVVSLIQRHMLTKPDEVAFKWPDKEKIGEWGDTLITDMPHKEITFKQFFGLVCKTAAGLKKVGIKHGDRVIIFLPMSIPLYQTMAAVQMIGASAVFLDSWARRDQLGVSADIADANAMISFEMAYNICKGAPELDRIPIKVVVGPHKETYTATLDEVQNNDPLMQVEAVKSDETALITFTTGSSGRPKGANRTHDFLAAQHYALHGCIPYTKEDIDLPAFPIFSLNNLAEGVLTIIPAIDIGRPSEKDPMILASQILSLNITCATLSPAMMVGLSKYCDENHVMLPSIRRFITGGAPISNETLALMKKSVPEAKIWVLYGSTEVEPIAHIEVEDILHPKHENAGEGVCVGHFAEGLDTKFIKIIREPIELKNDDWGSLELPTGKVGELLVAGLHVCKSYFNDPEAVKKTKVIESNGKVWHRTGDLACLDKDGNVWLVGRVHNAISRGDEMLFPVKAEMLMRKQDGVFLSAFLGMPDEKLGEKAYALVQLADDAKDRKDEILKKVAEALKAENIPFDYIDTVDHIPMDPRHHSKVEYGVLRKSIQNK